MKIHPQFNFVIRMGAFLFLASQAVISAVPESRVTVLAITGEAPSRGTGTFAEGMAAPVLSDNGQVAFVSNLRDGGFSSGSGVFRAGPRIDGVETVIVTGNPTPDLNGNISGASSVNTHLSINGSGDIVAFIDLMATLGGSLDNQAMYRMESNGGITQIMRTNDLAPGGDGRFMPMAKPGVRPRINDSGDVAFYATLRDTSDYAAVYRGNGSELIEIARRNRAAPGMNDPIIELFAQAVGLNRDGDVLFGAWKVEGGTALTGIFRGDGVSTKRIVQQGDPVPGGDGTITGGFSTGLGNLLFKGFNNRGEVAFRAVLTDTEMGTADNEAILFSDGETLLEIARKGEFVPDGNGRFQDFHSSVALNNRGEVLFLARITGGGEGPAAGVFVGDSGGVRLIARTGEFSPGGGSFSNFATAGYALNNRGHVVFSAWVDPEDGSSDRFGLFFYDPIEGVQPVIRNGDTLEGFGGVSNIILRAGGDVKHALDQSGFNDHGQLAFRCTVGNERVIAVWSPPAAPEEVRLRLAINHASGTMRLSWPASASDWELETVSDLTEPDG